MSHSLFGVVNVQWLTLDASWHVLSPFKSLSPLGVYPWLGGFLYRCLTITNIQIVLQIVVIEQPLRTGYGKQTELTSVSNRVAPPPPGRNYDETVLGRSRRN